MSYVLTCNCGEVVVKSMDGITKLRSKILVFKGAEAFLVCKGCGFEHPVPLYFNSLELKKSKNPRLLLFPQDQKSSRDQRLMKSIK